MISKTGKLTFSLSKDNVLHIQGYGFKSEHGSEEHHSIRFKGAKVWCARLSHSFIIFFFQSYSNSQCTTFVKWKSGTV